MGQNPLDDIPDASGLDAIPSLDAIPARKKKTRAEQTWWDKLTSPVPELAAAGHSLADRIRDYKTPAPEVSTEGASPGELAKGFVTGPLEGIKQFLENFGPAAQAFREHPMEATRGFGAGVLEGLSQASPLDLTLTAAGGKPSLKSIKSVGRGLAEGKVLPTGIKTEGAFAKAARRRTALDLLDMYKKSDKEANYVEGPTLRPTPDNPANVPRSGEGHTDYMRELMSRLVDPKTGKVIATRPGVMQPRPHTVDPTELLNRDIEALKKSSVTDTELPSPDDPQMPKMRSRGSETGPATSRSPAIPDAGGDAGFAIDSGRAAMRAGKRNATVRAERGELAAQLREERRLRAQALDALAAKNLPKPVPAKDGTVAKPVSIVERSDKVAEALQRSLEADGRPPKPTEPPAPSEAEGQAAVAEVLTRVMEQRPTAPTATPKLPALPGTPAKKALSGAAAQAEGRTLANLEKTHTRVRGETDMQSLFEIRDGYTKKAGLTKNPEKAAAYRGVAKAASDRIQVLAHMVKETPAETVPEVPAGPVVQKFDIQGRPVGAAPTPLPSMEAPRSPIIKTPTTPESRLATPATDVLPGESFSQYVERGTGIDVEHFMTHASPEMRAEFQRMYKEGRQRAAAAQAVGEPAPGEPVTEPIAPTPPPEGTGIAQGHSASPQPKPYVKLDQSKLESLKTPASERAPAPKALGRDTIAAGMGEDAAATLTKLASEAGAGPAPKGIDPVQHASMFALAQDAAEAAKKGTVDSDTVKILRAYYGAQSTADILGMKRAEVQKIAGGPHGRMPLQAQLSQLDRQMNRLIDDPAGFARTEALKMMAGAGAGALAGTAYANYMDKDIEEIAAWTLAGAAMGGAFFAPVKVRRAAADLHAEYDTANLLLGPAIIKTTFGAIGGVAMGMLELAQTGKHRQARAIWNYMKKEAARDYYRTFTAPSEELNKHKVGVYTGEMASKVGVEWKPTSKGGKLVRNLPIHVLRPFFAADEVGTKALMRGGFSRAEAGRMMVVGEPTSYLGQNTLASINKYWILRTLAKFPRVRIGGIERGIEYTPWLNEKWNTRTRQSQSHPRFKMNEQEGLTRAQLAARAKIGAGVIGAGALYGYTQDPSLRDMATYSSLAGPAYVPAAAAMTLGKGLANKELTAAIQDALLNLASNTPQIGEADVRRWDQRVVPLRPLRRWLGEE